MKHYDYRKHSIYLQMLALLLLAAVISFAAFSMMYSLSEYIVDRYMESTDYADKRNKKQIEALQAYIVKNNLHSRNTVELNRWVREQPLLSLSIYKDGIVVFNSNYPNHEIWEDEIAFVNYDWMSYDTIEFSDGEAEIQLTGAYRYQIFNMIRLLEMGLSFLIFLFVVLMGIRRKMAYIRLLSKEVEILETGSLNYQVTVKGKDELTMLAVGLESMRRSFLESRSREESVVRKNQRMITEMSHDLRTPITAVLLYTEIILNGKTCSSVQEKSYIEKIRQKVLLVKQRTDQLFAYSLKAEEENETEIKAGFFSDVFYEPLSEACGYLEQKGFRVVVKGQWPDKMIRYHEDYVIRIVDNIISNIIKYADVQKPVIIFIIQKKEAIGLLFQNSVDPSDYAIESTGIGLQNIEKLMGRMGGEYHSSCLKKLYEIEIVFPALNGLQGGD